MSLVKFFTTIFICTTLLSISISCSNITTKHDIRSTSRNKSLSLSTQEKAYTYFCTGYFLMLDKDWENAAGNFEKAILLDHSSEKTIRHLATCYYQLGKNEKSISFIEKLTKIKPHDFSMHYTLATLYEITGKHREAIAEYEHARRCKITKLDNVFLADALYKLANLYMNEGMMEKGAECYKSMFEMKLVNEPSKIYYEIGQKYFEKNDMKKALEYFLKAQDADPKLNFIHFYLTLCYDALNDYDNALNEAKIFLEKEPDNWAMHLALFEICGKTKNESKRNEEIEKAQEILKKDVDAGSKNPKEYFLLSQIYRNQHRTKEAIVIIENMKLLSLDKETERDAYYLLANLYYEDKKFDRVEEELEMALKIDPEFHEANNFLGYLFLEDNKNLDEAMALINKAVKAQPKNGAYLDSLGWAYYKKAQAEGRNDYLSKALQKLMEAVQLLEEPDIYEHIGDVNYSLGHWDRASDFWGKAQALYKRIPNNEAQIENITTKLEKMKRLNSVEKNLNVIVNCVKVESSVQP
ncbi:MAG: tetratricopeptide repeat protein [Planctomycetota bacterium]|nr:tetratricopeptide repeat protein [Planctomycetota bacterium]